MCVTVNGGPKPLTTDELGNLRRQLQEIRNRVVHLLDNLETSNLSSSANDTDGAVAVAAGKQTSAAVTSSSVPASRGEKEFNLVSAHQQATREVAVARQSAGPVDAGKQHSLHLQAKVIAVSYAKVWFQYVMTVKTLCNHMLKLSVYKSLTRKYKGYHTSALPSGAQNSAFATVSDGVGGAVARQGQPPYRSPAAQQQQQQAAQAYLQPGRSDNTFTSTEFLIHKLTFSRWSGEAVQ